MAEAQFVIIIAGAFPGDLDLCPYRAIGGIGRTQGVALGYGVMPFQGVSIATLRDLSGVLLWQTSRKNGPKAQLFQVVPVVVISDHSGVTASS